MSAADLIQATCQGCGSAFEMKPQAVGKRTRCDECRHAHDLAAKKARHAAGRDFATRTAQATRKQNRVIRRDAAAATGASAAPGGGPFG